MAYSHKPDPNNEVKDNMTLAREAVLLESEPMPQGVRQVAGIDFNKLAGSTLKVCDLVDAMAGMGFQASSVATAVTTINQMVCQTRASLSRIISLTGR